MDSTVEHRGLNDTIKIEVDHDGNIWPLQHTNSNEMHMAKKKDTTRYKPLGPPECLSLVNKNRKGATSPERRRYNNDLCSPKI